jgi:hypothetical protein
VTDAHHDADRRRDPYWYVTATWNLWTIDRLRLPAATRELALAEAQRLIALHSPEALAQFGTPAIELYDSYRDDRLEPYRQIREDFTPEQDPDRIADYRAEVAAEAAELVERLRAGGGVLIGYTSRRSPVDYGLFFVDVYDEAERMCLEAGIDVVGGHLDDIGLELRPG